MSSKYLAKLRRTPARLNGQKKKCQRHAQADADNSASARRAARDDEVGGPGEDPSHATNVTADRGPPPKHVTPRAPTPPTDIGAHTLYARATDYECATIARPSSVTMRARRQKI